MALHVRALTTGAVSVVDYVAPEVQVGCYTWQNQIQSSMEKIAAAACLFWGNLWDYPFLVYHHNYGNRAR